MNIINTIAKRWEQMTIYKEILEKLPKEDIIRLYMELQIEKDSIKAYYDELIKTCLLKWQGINGGKR